ncbi:hypothetical protein [Lacrimispora defluvii]|uniref:Uncharacterized protein n=1 Tax=Lacrimispora defluvii TaxID=2719233 RepID=A0ABX1VLQ6_9FIRM|nr:hypothetical protein [Lacrimispora defluvii]NNJ29171.1 hypothetical protein [Lacrimispora defluvii]
MLAAASTGAAFVITEEMLAPIVTSITSNSTVLIPVGLTIMGIMVGIGLIPRIIYKFL